MFAKTPDFLTNTAVGLPTSPDSLGYELPAHKELAMNAPRSFRVVLVVASMVAAAPQWGLRCR